MYINISFVKSLYDRHYVDIFISYLMGSRGIRKEVY